MESRLAVWRYSRDLCLSLFESPINFCISLIMLVSSWGSILCRFLYKGPIRELSEVTWEPFPLIAYPTGLPGLFAFVKIVTPLFYRVNPQMK